MSAAIIIETKSRKIRLAFDVSVLPRDGGMIVKNHVIRPDQPIAAVSNLTEAPEIHS